MTDSIFDPGILPLQKGIVYGPVLSRRLGYSLGVNLLSPYQKICSFDCIYCQYGRTGVKTRTPEPASLYTGEEIFKEIEKALLSGTKLDYITFSGNGEPTLHPQFDQIVNKVADIRNRLKPDVKLALFSNSTELCRSNVRSALKLIDHPILKVDACNQDLFEKINRPINGISLDKIISQFRGINSFTLQSLFLKGRVTNADDDSVVRWIELVKKIQPKDIQIYSTDRADPEEGLEVVPPRDLMIIAEKVRTITGIPAKAYWPN